MGAELAVAACVFLAVSALVLYVLSGGRSLASAAERRIGGLRLPAGPGIEAEGLLTRRTSPVPFVRHLVARNGDWATRTALELQRAGLNLKVSEYLLVRVLLAGVGAALTFFVSGGGPRGMLLAIPLALVGLMLPALYVHVRRTRREAQISSQLVEALQLISNSLRSGFAFTQAVELAAKQLQPPIEDELNYFLRDNALGARMEDALRSMVERSGSVDLEMVVTSILVQRTTGGNLSEILDTVSETIRERSRLRAEIKSLTSQQRLTGQILSVYPVFLAVVFFLISPSIMSVLWESEAGLLLLGIAASLQVIGALAIRRILTLDV